MATDTKTRSQDVLNDAGATGTAEHPTSQAQGTRINLNTATRDELTRITPQIGVERADSMIKFREAFGGFKSVEDVKKIPGFGEKLMTFIRAFSYVEGDANHSSK